jgi:hypothetical protein
MAPLHAFPPKQIRLFMLKIFCASQLGWVGMRSFASPEIRQAPSSATTEVRHITSDSFLKGRTFSTVMVAHTISPT